MVRAKQNDNSMEEDGESSGGVYENHATPTLITVTTMLSAREEEKGNVHPTDPMYPDQPMMRPEPSSSTAATQI